MGVASPKTHEPSMEEILASIRRIIADDQTAKVAEPPPQEAESHDASPESSDEEDEFDEDEDETEYTEEDDVLDLADEDDIEEEDDDMARSSVLSEDFTPPANPVSHEAPTSAPAEASPPPASPRQSFEALKTVTDSSKTEKDFISRDPSRLLSPGTDSSVSSAFNTLAQTMLTVNARSLEDLVGEMLRPMLKVWLDDNLPTVVERMVRQEIERVARGGRG